MKGVFWRMMIGPFVISGSFVIYFLLNYYDNEDFYSVEEKEYIVENVEFESDFWDKGNAVFIDTEEKTFVAPLKNLSIIKTTEENILKVNSHFYRGEESREKPTEYTLYVSESRLKETSKKFTNTYKTTIPVIEE